MIFSSELRFSFFVDSAHDFFQEQWVRKAKIQDNTLPA